MTWRRVGLVVVSIWATSSFAATLPVSLIWQAPSPCPQYAEVWSQLSERLGRAPETPEGSAFAARAVAEPVDGGWKLELQTLTESGTGQRVLTAPTCEEVTRRAVVVLALAIDPLLEAPPEVPPRRLWLALGPSMSFGVLPYPAAGLLLDGRFEVQSFSVELTFGTALPQRLANDATRTLTISSPLSGSVAGCVGLERQRYRIGGCVAVGASLLWATPEGVAHPLVGMAALLDVGPRLEARVLLSPRWALRLYVGGAAALSRPTFGYSDGSTAWQPTLFSASTALLVEFRGW